MLHGDGSPTRNYLYAGDAANAFDTILHKGSIGQIYNVGSYDEVSNTELCDKLLTYLDIPHGTPEEKARWIKYTHDRPFNDKRYAVDGSKLRALGWDQQMSFQDGMAITVDWYSKFGERWWGDITKVLTPFPEVSGKRIVGEGEHRDAALEGALNDFPNSLKKRKLEGLNGHANGVVAMEA